MLSGLIVTVLTVIVVFSLRERVRLRRHYLRDKNWDAISENKTSIMSQSIASMVGTAGGIYLSVMVLFSFLEVELPPKVNLMGMRFEPIAAVSFALALIQPFVLRIMSFSRRI